MKVKKRISQEFISQLSDWEILTAFTYTDRILKRENSMFENEFNDLCFFFFDGDVKSTILSLQEVKELYTKEYSTRRQN